MSVSSGEEVWFDKGVDVALLRDGNEEIETIEFIVVRVKPNTAVLLLEISAMETSNLPRMIKQSNKVKGWTYSIPIVIQE